MNIYTAYETDKAKERDGAWVRDVRPGLHLRITRMPNPAYNKLFGELIAPHRVQFERDSLDDEVLRDVITQCLAETVLVDWEGLEDRDGEPVTYSVAKARKLMTELPDFRDDVLSLARNRDLFKAKEEDEDRGNSEQSSAGDCAGPDSQSTTASTTSSEPRED